MISEEINDMRKLQLIIGSSGLIALIITRELIRILGINNASVQTKIFILFIILIIYAVKAFGEKDKIVRKFSIISSLLFFIFGILLSFLMISKEVWPQIYNKIRMPLGIVLILLFASILIPIYAAYFAKSS
jgi:hypothetical protein